ncbi:uncharacterized protein [Aristolochia californica]|uniref:uncharacterized protein n=1 Tax=Aristolochia californica TaxID=171875 RepID=UPI0035E17E6E
MADVSTATAHSALRSISVFLLFSFCLLSPVVGSRIDSPAVRLLESEPDLCPGEAHGSCPVNCFRPDPVCGANGITYWCGCPDAQCAGTRVVSLGPCEVQNGASGTVSGQAFLLLHIVWLLAWGLPSPWGLADGKL